MLTDETIVALRELIGITGTDDAVRVDDSERLQVFVPEAALGDVVPIARKANTLGAIVQLQISLSDTDLVLEAHDDGWSADGDISILGPPKSRFTDSDVTSHLTTGTLVLTFSKETWGTPWIGWSVATLSRWLRQLNLRTAAEAVFDKGPARLGLVNWEAGRVCLGTALVLGDPNESPPAPNLNWPEQRPAWQRLASTIDPQLAPDELREALCGMASVGAVHLLSEVIRQRSDGAYEFRLGPETSPSLLLTKDDAQEHASTLRDVVDWVAREPSLTRLIVARRTLRTRLISEGWSGVGEGLTAHSEVAYAAPVDDQVAHALDAQASFENHILEFSTKTNEVVREIDKTTDDVATRTIAALVAILITGVFAKDVRGWPLMLAALFVASYVVWTSWHVLGSYKLALHASSRLLQRGTSTRPYGISDGVATQLEVIESNARNRIRFRQLVLALLAVAVVATGIGILVSDNSRSTVSTTSPPGTPTSAPMKQ